MSNNDPIRPEDRPTEYVEKVPETSRMTESVEPVREHVTYNEFGEPVAASQTDVVRDQYGRPVEEMKQTSVAGEEALYLEENFQGNELRRRIYRDRDNANVFLPETPLEGSSPWLWGLAGLLLGALLGGLLTWGIMSHTENKASTAGPAIVTSTATVKPGAQPTVTKSSEITETVTSEPSVTTATTTAPAQTVTQPPVTQTVTAQPQTATVTVTQAPTP